MPKNNQVPALSTILTILQQGEYEWQHYIVWKEANPQYKQVLSPKKRTAKLNVLEYVGKSIPIGDVEMRLKITLLLLSLPQSIIVYFLLFSARLKLRRMQGKGLIVISVAGSYAKTSTKTVLHHVLSGSKPTLVTPGNINREVGIARLILDKLSSEHAYFIVELGEYDPGDLSSMIAFLKPTYRILTPLTIAHLERFSNENELNKEFMSYMEGCPQENGLIYQETAGMFPTQYMHYGKDNVANVVLSRAGTEFEVMTGDITSGGDTFSCFIQLYGEHNAVNTLPAFWIAGKLSLSSQAVVKRLKSLLPVEHRLEPHHLEQNILILDNGYNANPKSSTESLKVLQAIDGTQKIVTTPGFVELGNRQYEENRQLGNAIAAVADLCILINGVNAPALKEGLLEGGMALDAIYFADSEEDGLALIQSSIKPGAVILFENSIPELYKTIQR